MLFSFQVLRKKNRRTKLLVLSSTSINNVTQTNIILQLMYIKCLKHNRSNWAANPLGQS